MNRDGKTLYEIYKVFRWNLRVCRDAVLLRFKKRLNLFCDVISTEIIKNKFFKLYPPKIYPSNEFEISVIIVNYKTKYYLKKAIESLRKTNMYNRLEIIVVDNNSQDGSVEEVINKYTEVKLIELFHNFGLIVARNIGIKFSTAPFIMFLDSDIEPDSGAIENLYKFLLEHADVAVAAGRLRSEQGLTINAPYKFPTFKHWAAELFLSKSILEVIGLNWKIYYNSNTPFYADWVGAGFSMTHKKFFSALGLPDERFFFFNEDIDFCKRVSANGLKVVYLPSASGIHYGSRATYHNKQELNKFRFYNIQSKLIFASKYWGGSLYNVFSCLVFMRIFVLVVIDFLLYGKKIDLSLQLSCFNQAKR